MDISPKEIETYYDSEVKRVIKMVHRLRKSTAQWCWIFESLGISQDQLHGFEGSIYGVIRSLLPKGRR